MDAPGQDGIPWWKRNLLFGAKSPPIKVHLLDGIGLDSRIDLAISKNLPGAELIMCGAQ